MKRIFAVLTALLLCLCSCSSADYGKALEKWNGQSAFTLDVHNEMCTTDEDGATEQTDTDLTLTRSDEGYQASVTYDESQTVYYYKSGTVYSDAADGAKYRWEDDESGFLSELCYAPPLEISLSDAQKESGEYVYTVSLNGTDYTDLLLSLNPAFSGLDAQQVSFSSFLYTATVKKGRLAAYGYEYAFTVSDEEIGTLDVHNVLQVSVQSKAEKIVFPANEADYTETVGGFEDLGLSVDEYNEQVLYVIFESLYNEDGSKSENFDSYYKQFEEQFGAEFMQKITEAADLFRGVQD